MDTCTEEERHKEAVVVFEVMAELAVVPAQSVLTHEINDDGDDDMTPAGHVTRSIELGVGGDGSVQGSPKKVDSAEKFH